MAGDPIEGPALAVLDDVVEQRDDLLIFGLETERHTNGVKDVGLTSLVGLAKVRRHSDAECPCDQIHMRENERAEIQCIALE